MKKILIIILTLCSLSLLAQRVGHNVAINLGGGASSLYFKTNIGEWQPNVGGTLDFSYRYFFNNAWGISAGIGANFLNSKVNLSGVDYSAPLFDESNNQKYFYKTYMQSLKEVQQALYVEVPIMAHYSHDISESWGIMVGVGAKLQASVWDRFNVRAGSVITSGYYPELKQIFTHLPQHGFDSYSVNESGVNDLNRISVAAILDFGFNWHLNNNLDLYTGLFAAYGFLNNKADKNSEPFVYDDRGYHSALHSNVKNDVKNFSAGLKVGISFNIEKKQDRVSRSDRRVVKQINSMINALPSPKLVDMQSVKEINNALYAYNEISPKQQNMIDKSLRKKLMENVDNAAQVVLADSVVRAVDKLPKQLDTLDIEMVLNIEKQYERLDEFGKMFVNKTYRSKLKRLVKQAKALSKAIAFYRKVDSLPLLVDYNSRFEVLEARNLYNKLLPEEQEVIPAFIYRRLIVAEQRIEDLSSFMYLVNDISLNYNMKNIERAKSARNLYEKMGNTTRKLVPQYHLNRLVTAEKFIKNSQPIFDYNVDTLNLLAPEKEIYDIVKRNKLILFFELNKVIYGPTSKQLSAILQIIDVLNKYPELCLVIRGYACKIGATQEVNQIIAYERAMSVKAQFELYKAPSERLIVETYIQDNAIASNLSVEEQAYGRRVDFATRIIKSSGL